MATILIVDDLPANRKVLVTLLRYEGHRMVEAADGREGLAAVHAEHPDLVITDVLMPVMDGYEFIRQLRLDPATRGIPVVFCTAHYGEREARELALSSGVSYVLAKPAEADEVLRIVTHALAHESSPVGSPDASTIATEFDREHLRLVTDKLSEKAGDLKTANERLRALINIGLDLASEREPERLLHNVCAAARDLFGATYVTLGILDRNDRTVQRLFTSGSDADSWMKTGDAVSGILRTVVDERRTMRGDNPGGDPARLQFPLLHPEVQAFLVAPIASPSHVYGWMCLVGNEGRSFTEDDEPLVMALSGQVGRIYENGYFYEVARQERDRAQRYLNTGDIILLALDTEGRITLVNRHACAILGWSADELMGRDWVETCLPDRMRDALRIKFHNLIDGDLSIVENPVLTKSGEERLIEWRNTVLRDDAGTVVGTFSSGTDVTERKRAEEAHRASEGRYRTLFQYAPDGIVIADRQSYYLDANTSICRMLGYTREELIGLHAADIVVAAEVPFVEPALREIAASSDYQREWLFRRKDGSTFAADVMVTTMPDGNLLGMIRDVTERNQSIEAQRAAEERMRFALQSAAVGIWDMDYTTGVLRWSETIEAHYGLLPGTFAGTFEAFVERVHPDDRASMLDAVGTAMKSGTDFSVQNRSVWPDGTVRWLTGAGRILLGEHGEPVRGVGISLDVTEQRLLEEQLRQAQKLEAIGQLAGGVAHDFNNVLTAILGFSELMLSGLSSSDPLRADVLQIKSAGERAAGLTRQLLAFSRKQILQPKVLNINATISDMEPMLKRLILEHVNLMISLMPDVGPIKMDPTQVEQILVNLVVNASDAMPRGGKLTVETGNVTLDEHYQQRHLPVTPGDYVMLAVSDTGVGMDETTSRRIFEPFFTTKGVGKGTGLGLATVYGIVKQSGGDIWVYSEVGHGTTFKIYLPQVTAGLQAGIERVTDGGDLSRGSETILLVEDDDAVRLLARVTLERAGYRVLHAENPKEAMRLVRDSTGPIHLLLSDVIMPESEGPPLFDRLVSMHPGLRLLYMSGYADEAISRHGVLVEGTPFLQKPFTPVTLARKIRNVLEAQPTAV
jgi:PAS domain S-box-containing protein